MMRARLLLLGVLAALAACVQERERLDPPRVTLELGEQQTTPGGTITGTVTAVDRSGGIILVSVTAQAGDSTFRQRQDFIGEDSTTLIFGLHVASNAPDSAEIIVRATAIDEQNFVVIAEDTAVVLVPVP